MDIQDCKTLHALYHTKSLAQASTILYISQPALTRRIKRLENEFQAELLIRSSKGVLLTSRGEQLAHFASDMLNQYQAIKKNLSSSDEIMGTIRIAASFSASQFFLPGLLDSFRRSYGKIAFEVTSDYSSSCIKALLSGQVQIAFFKGNHTGNFVKEILQTQRAFILCKDKIQLKDLPALPYIRFDADHSGVSIRDNWWYDMFDCPPYVAMTVRNENICYEMVRHGLGFGIFMNRNLLKEDDSLYAYPLSYRDGRPVIRNDWVGYKKNALFEKLTATFVRFSKEYAKNNTSIEDEGS